MKQFVVIPRKHWTWQLCLFISWLMLTLSPTASISSNRLSMPAFGHTVKPVVKLKNGQPASKSDLREVSHLLSEQMDHLLTLTKDNVAHYTDMVKELKLINKRQMDLGYAAGFDAWIKRLWSTLAVSAPTGIFIGLTMKMFDFIASHFAA